MNILKKNLLLFALMAVACGGALALKPRTKVADIGPAVNLETMVPASFGDWSIDNSIVPLMISPEVQAKLDKIYNQTLSRTYVDRQGRRIMLSIAYGGDQSDSTQLHRPEVCYAAQGFQVGQNVKAELQSGYGALPVRRLMATQGLRKEPITYWISVGNTLVTSHFQQKIVQLKYGLRGVIPDGFLVRISALTADKEAGYELEQAFAQSMLGSMSTADRERMSSRDMLAAASATGEKQ
jgi:EpsI family protein